MNQSSDTVQTILNNVRQRFADSRIYHCQVEAADITGNTVYLQGEVLDRETLAAVKSELATQLPDMAVDSTAVQVLRQPKPSYLVVSSNITELYEGPSFLAARSTTLLNGTVGELLKEDGRWAYLRLGDGYLGWHYRPYLSTFEPRGAAAATHLVRVPSSLLREEPEENASSVSRVFAGTYIILEAAEAGWAQIALAGGLTGYLPLADLCPLETLPLGEGRRTQIGRDAFDYTGVPYLWGGGSVLGIDCSGYSQLLHRLAGVTIPRDADMQFAAGRPVEEPFQLGDLFFFGSEGAHRSISHVGVSLGDGWRMVHSSRSRNGVYVDDVAAVDHLRKSFLGARSFL